MGRSDTGGLLLVMKKQDGIKYRGQGRKSVDKHRLLAEYYRLKKALGRKPICSDYLFATKIIVRDVRDGDGGTGT